MKMPQRRLSKPSFGGMLSTRHGAVVLAAVCAVCAAGILMFALGRYKSNVKAPTVVPQAYVLVATGQIAKGTSGADIAAQKLYHAMPVAASQVSPGAISDASALAGRSAATTILAGQQLTVADLTAQATIPNQLAPDQRAITLSIADVAGSIPLVQTGDEVDLYSQFSNKGGGSYNVLLERGAPVLQSPTVPAVAPAAGTSSTAGASTSTTASSSASSSSSSGSGTATLVLGVTTSQVARVIYAAQNSSLYIAVRPTKANHTPAVVTNLGTVLTGALSDNTTGARP